MSETDGASSASEVEATGHADNGPRAHIHRRTVEYGDLDANAHVNNVVYLRYFETARIELIQVIAPVSDPARAQSDEGLILAECHVAYRSPAVYGETLDVAVGPGAVWRSAFRVELEIRCADDGRDVADGWCVLVAYDYKDGSAIRLPDPLREALLAAGGLDERRG